MNVTLLTALSVSICVATLLTSLTIILLRFKSVVLRDDVVFKVMTSMCATGLGIGFIVPVVAFVMANCAVDYSWLIVFQGFVFGVCRMNTLWQLALLAVFKCCVIARPLQYFRLFTERVVNAIIVAIFLVSVLIVLGCFLGGLVWKLDRDVFIVFNSNSTPYLVLGFELHLVSTILIMIACYLKIFLVVRQHLRQISSTTVVSPEIVSVSSGSHFKTFHSGTGYSQRSTIFASSVRSSKNLFIISFCNLLTYVPGALVSGNSEMPKWMVFIGKWLYLAGAAENSLLYIVLHKTVRRELAKVLRLTRNCCRH